MKVRDGGIYICKNDIRKNWSFLCKRGFGAFSVSCLEREFDNYIDDYGHDKVFLTGSQTDKKKQRHTKFVDLYKFYKYCVNSAGL